MGCRSGLGMGKDSPQEQSRSGPYSKVQLVSMVGIRRDVAIIGLEIFKILPLFNTNFAFEKVKTVAITHDHVKVSRLGIYYK